MTPEGDDLIADFRLEFIGEAEEGTIERGAIIACEFNEPGFDDKTAEFDEVAGAFAALHDPVPRIKPGLPGFEPMTKGCGLAQRFPVGQQLHLQ